MTVSIFRPDAHVESSSFDGYIRNSECAPAQPWGGMQSATCGNCANDSGTSMNIGYSAAGGGCCNRYARIDRTYITFDTSSIPCGNVISSATLGVVAKAVVNTFSGGDSMILVTNTVSSTTALAVADFNNVGTVNQATASIPLACITANSCAVTTFTLNSTGIGNITKDGATKFALRSLKDSTDTEPTWGADHQERVTMETADGCLSCKEAILTVTHAPAFIQKSIIF